MAAPVALPDPSPRNRRENARTRAPQPRSYYSNLLTCSLPSAPQRGALALQFLVAQLAFRSSALQAPLLPRRGLRIWVWNLPICLLEQVVKVFLGRARTSPAPHRPQKPASPEGFRQHRRASRVFLGPPRFAQSR